MPSSARKNGGATTAYRRGTFAKLTACSSGAPPLPPPGNQDRCAPKREFFTSAVSVGSDAVRNQVAAGFPIQRLIGSQTEIMRWKYRKCSRTWAMPSGVVCKAARGWARAAREPRGARCDEAAGTLRGDDEQDARGGARGAGTAPSTASSARRLRMAKPGTPLGTMKRIPEKAKSCAGAATE